MNELARLVWLERSAKRTVFESVVLGQVQQVGILHAQQVIDLYCMSYAPYSPTAYGCLTDIHSE